VESEDLIKFGFIPEFIGRFAVVATLNPLKEEDLIRVLIEPKNSLIKQYEEFFKMEGVKLSFLPEALQEVARKAMKKGTGARALRSILETSMLDVMYDVPSEGNIVECVVTRGVVEGKETPRLIRSGDWVKTA
jgi:ATP-dependent Clp protease ATP-binding subunit ClpX